MAGRTGTLAGVEEESRVDSLLRALRRSFTPDALCGVAVFALALAVYNATLTPSLSYASPDGNELATVPHELGLVHSTGYPLYTIAGKLFTFLPIGDVAHRMNLMSAASAAGAAALAFGCLRLLSVNRVASLFGALFFAFSTTLWSQAVITEVYAANVFMLALVLFLMLAWGRSRTDEAADLPSDALFWACCFAYSLSLGLHLSNLALAPAIAVYVLLTDWRIILRRRALLPGAGLFVLGLVQYVWLPLRASTLLDLPMQRNSPDTLEGFYNYTLNAFPQMKFAFPLEAIPDRIVLYLQLVRANFGYMGIALGLFGMWEMLWRRTAAFYLLFILYLIQVFFFIQYSAFDIDVFFIPAHMMVALFAAFAVHRVMDYVPALAGRFRLATPAYAALGIVAILPIAVMLERNSERNDQSDNTAVNDFYEEVFERLPPNSALLGLRGVFGYDMFYFRFVYDYRPDILIPFAQDSIVDPDELVARPLFTTIRPYGELTRNAFTPPPYLMREELWYTPVLVSPTAENSFGRLRGMLTLYEARLEPPQMIVPEAHPSHLVGHDFGGLRLVGFDIDRTDVERGDTVHLVVYWQMTRPSLYLVATRIGDSRLQESHPLGFGGLQRYVQEMKPRGGFVKEEYDLLVPSSTEAGAQTLRMGLQPLLPEQEAAAQMVDLVELTIHEPSDEPGGRR